MKIKISTIIILFLFSIGTKAQNPFEELGVEVEVLTLSKGRFCEFFPNDTIVRIGTVIFNTVTNQVVDLVVIDSTNINDLRLQPYITSRWLSPDPLAEKIPEWSPYNFCRGNPINRIDPNGLLDGWIEDEENGTVFWDPNVNSQEEFDNSDYTSNSNMSYAGQDYELPDGSGSITVSTWEEFNEDGFVGVDMEVTFTPNEANEGVQANYLQTVSSDIHAEVWGDKVQVLDKPVQFVDIRPPSYDATKSDFYNTEDISNYSISDMVGRSSVGKNVSWKAETSLVVKNSGSYSRSVTFDWGFSISKTGQGKIQPITIRPDSKTCPSKFHMISFKNLPIK